MSAPVFIDEASTQALKRHALRCGNQLIKTGDVIIIEERERKRQAGEMKEEALRISEASSNVEGFGALLLCVAKANAGGHAATLLNRFYAVNDEV